MFALIIEDNPTDQAKLRKLLESFNVICDIAGNYYEAISKMNQKTYAFITLDLVLNGNPEEGTYLLNKIKGSFANNCPVIIVSESANLSTTKILKFRFEFIKEAFSKDDLSDTIKLCELGKILENINPTGWQKPVNAEENIPRDNFIEKVLFRKVYNLSLLFLTAFVLICPVLKSFGIITLSQSKKGIIILVAILSVLSLAKLIFAKKPDLETKLLEVVSKALSLLKTI